MLHLPFSSLLIPSPPKMSTALSPHRDQQEQASFPLRPTCVHCGLIRNPYTCQSHCLCSKVHSYNSDDSGRMCLCSFTGDSFPKGSPMWCFTSAFAPYRLLAALLSLGLGKNSWLWLSKLCLNKLGPHCISLGYRARYIDSPSWMLSKVGIVTEV